MACQTCTQFSRRGCANAKAKFFAVRFPCFYPKRWTASHRKEIKVGNTWVCQLLKGTAASSFLTFDCRIKFGLEDSALLPENHRYLERTGHNWFLVQSQSFDHLFPHCWNQHKPLQTLNFCSDFQDFTATLKSSKILTISPHPPTPLDILA